jgi:Flp pilus assembly protein protease CpaA
MNPDTYFLSAVVALGVVSTLSDLRVRKVSNLWTIISLAYAVIVHIALFVSGNQQEIFWSLHSFVNILASTIVAVYFWRENWWGGGDAKLFVCYSALIPLSHYPFGYFGYYFASFLLLIITFVPAAIWTFIHAQIGLIKSGKNIYSNFHPSKERIEEFLHISVGFTAIFFLSKLLILALNQYCHWIKDFPFLIWLFMMGFYKTVLKLFQKWSWLPFLSWGFGICIILFVPLFQHLNVWNVLSNSFVSWILLFILRRYVFRTIEHYVELTKNNNIAFAGWMFLGALIIWFLSQ